MMSPIHLCPVWLLIYFRDDAMIRFFIIEFGELCAYEFFETDHEMVFMREVDTEWTGKGVDFAF
jgi:hypothetical protein